MRVGRRAYYPRIQKDKPFDPLEVIHPPKNEDEYAAGMRGIEEQRRKEEMEREMRSWLSEMQSKPQSYWDSIQIDDCYL